MKSILTILLFIFSFNSFSQNVKEKQVEDLKAYDKKRGNPRGIIFSQTGFANLDTFITGASTPTVVNNMLVDSIGPGGCALGCEIQLKYVTMLERWAIKSEFKVGRKNTTSTGVDIGIKSASGFYQQDIIGRVLLRSDAPFDGYLQIVDNALTHTNILATSLTKLSFSEGDSIQAILVREINIFTLIARNITTGGDIVRVSYTYGSLEIAANTGRPYWSVIGGIDSIYHFEFSSEENLNADVMLVGDSKGTWYGSRVNESIPRLMYSKFGNVINLSGGGNRTAEVALIISEIIRFNPKVVLLFIGSNDIRFGVSESVRENRIDSIYNVLTAAGIEVRFSLMYETDVSQATLIDHLETNYSDEYIAEGYESGLYTRNTLLGDNIHQNAYGKSQWVDGVIKSGKLIIHDFNTNNLQNKNIPTYKDHHWVNAKGFREIRFILPDVDYILEGDSIIVDDNFINTKTNVFRNGILQWKDIDYEISIDTLTLHPAPEDDERIIIHIYDTLYWENLVIVPPVFIGEECVVFNTASGLTESPSCTWSGDGGKGYSTTTLAAGDDGYFMAKDTDGANTTANPIGLDDDGNNTEDYNLWEFCLYSNGATYTIISETAGEINTGVAYADGDWIRLRKEGSVIYAEKSTTSGVSWTLVYTYVADAGHTLYAKTHMVVSGKKIIDATIYNFH